MISILARIRLAYLPFHFDEYCRNKSTRAIGNLFDIDQKSVVNKVLLVSNYLSFLKRFHNFD